MHQKLYLVVSNIVDSADTELISNNLKSLDGVKVLTFLSAKKHLEIKMEINNLITKQQIFDVIRIGGDFKIEEQEEGRVKNNPEHGKSESNPVSSGVIHLNQAATEANPSKRAFIFGVICGILVICTVGFFILLADFISGKEGSPSVKGNNQVVALDNNQAPIAPIQPGNLPTATVQKFEITKDDHVRGNFDALVTLVEYSDFQCPFCARHYPTLKKILADYAGKVRMVYKHFPLTQLHPFAQKAAEASECASEQGKFWEYHDKLFDNQDGSYSLDYFKQLASDLNLNTGKFNDCLDSDKYAGKVQADEADGQNRGVQGTPATFVNGQAVSGAVPYESFKSIIDKLLNNN